MKTAAYLLLESLGIMMLILAHDFPSVLRYVVIAVAVCAVRCGYWLEFQGDKDD